MFYFGVSCMRIDFTLSELFSANLEKATYAQTCVHTSNNLKYKTRFVSVKAWKPKVN